MCSIRPAVCGIQLPVMLSCLAMTLTENIDSGARTDMTYSHRSNTKCNSAAVTAFDKENNGYEYSADHLILGNNHNDHIVEQVTKFKNHCGELCDIGHSSEYNNTKFADELRRKDPNGNLVFHFQKKNVSCSALWNTSMFDEPTRFKNPPIDIPKPLKTHFSYNNQIPIESYYLNDNEQRTKDNTMSAKGILNLILKNVIKFIIHSYFSLFVYVL